MFYGGVRGGGGGEVGPEVCQLKMLESIGLRFQG